MILKHALDSWDGKSTADLAKIYAVHCDDAGFVDALLSCCLSDSHQRGATWLLNHHLANDHPLSPQQTSTLLSGLAVLTDWQARLHVLQSLPHLHIQAGQETAVEHFLRANLADSNKFVRAWAYSGFYQLGQQYPDYADEAEGFLDMALRDEAPAVKARIRQLRR